MIVFNEELHTYTNTDNNKIYRSATTVLGDYTHEFDSNFHAERIAKREGVTIEFILEMWKAETKKATDKGTKIHKIMEDYVKSGIIGEYGSHEFYASYDTIVTDHVIKYKTVLSEQLLYTHEYEIAGTADLIFENDKSFTVGDFKTNKKFRYRTDFNDYLKDPISHLAHCEFNSYALQLSLYAYMYEIISGKICSNLIIFYLKDGHWTPKPVNYLKSDVVNLLNHYKNNK